MFNSQGVSRADGPGLSLRLIQPADARYVYGLRIDPDYNHHLSAVQGTAEDQRAWIDRYKAREAQLTELYYIIERRNGTPCGTLRLYGIGHDTFEWGSWILDHNKPRKAALESAVLAYHIAFDVLKRNKARFDVRRDNAITLEFHRRFGAVETHADETDIFFEYPKLRFEADCDAHWSVMHSASAPAA